MMKRVKTLNWRPLLIISAAVAILALQILAFINVETPPISFKYETVPGDFNICRGQALKYTNTFIVNNRSPILYIRSVAVGHIEKDDVKHVTVQTDQQTLYFNVWEAQERLNTLTFTPTATLAPGNYTLIVSASGINSNYQGVAMYKLEFTTRDC